MNTNWFCRLVIPGLLLASSATTQANDIVDFLRAINGVDRHHEAPPAYRPVGQHGHGHESPVYGHSDRPLTSRDIQKVQMANRQMGYGAPHGNDMHEHRAYSNPNVSLRAPHNGLPAYTRPSRGRISFQVSSVNGMSSGYGGPHYYPAGQQYQELPPVQELPPIPNYESVPSYPVAPAYPMAPQYPQVIAPVHQIGEIVTCPVPLATCVRVEDACNIAPDAIPVVVAVRDPNMCAHDTVERVVFVQVLVPPCPMSGLRVSPCRTRVTMCFHQYEVDIKSKNGIIVVDYDD